MTVWKRDREAKTKVRQTPGPESMTTPVVRPSGTQGTARDHTRLVIASWLAIAYGSDRAQTAGGSRSQVARDRRRSQSQAVRDRMYCIRWPALPTHEPDCPDCAKQRRRPARYGSTYLVAVLRPDIRADRQTAPEWHAAMPTPSRAAVTPLSPPPSAAQ